MEKIKKNKGITLIALVITIIVLLILSGVSLSMVLNQDGIFSRAENARTRQEIAQLKEALEMAKKPVLIDGVGKIDKEQYFDEIQRQELINDKTKDVVDNGDGTYDVTTKPGHVFLIELLPTKENPRDIKVTYLGEVGKLPPKIKGIKTTPNKVNRNIKAEIEVVRLEDGDLTYYYREVTEEDEEKREEELEYTLVKKNSKDLETTIGNLTEGKIYKIKVVAKNKYGEHTVIVKEAIQQLVKTITLNKTSEMIAKDKTLQLTVTSILPETAEDKTVEWLTSDSTIATVDNNGLVTTLKNGDVVITVKAKDGGDAEASCSITVKVPVTGVSLNKSTATVKPEKTITLIATVHPEDATNKAVTWDSSDKTVATVNQAGVVSPVSGVTSGTTTITVTSNDDMTKSASCTVEVSQEDDWNYIAKIAKEIAEGRTTETVNRNSTQATVTVEGNEETIKVKQDFYVKHDGQLRKVRVLGFNHDILTNPTEAYGAGTTATTAGISFEFAGPITDTRKPINSNGKYTGGWALSEMRTWLEGAEGIGKLSEACKINIKQVNKPYIKIYNNANSVTNSPDKLWLMSAAEVGWFTNKSDGDSGVITEEGKTYCRYQGSFNYEKYKLDEFPDGCNWWIRSPCYYAETWGRSASNRMPSSSGPWFQDSLYVKPGFCI